MKKADNVPQSRRKIADAGGDEANTTATMGKRAVGYGRLGPERTGRKIFPVEGQEAAARRYADRHGLALTAFFWDYGATGADMKRPGLQAVLALVAARVVDVVIVEEVDRLSRDPVRLRQLAAQFRAHGVALHIVAGGRT